MTDNGFNSCAPEGNHMLVDEPPIKERPWGNKGHTVEEWERFKRMMEEERDG